MPKGKVSFIVTARDMMSRGLKRARASVKRFAKAAAVSFVALAGIAVLAVKRIWAEYSKQATAVAKLESVLKATGHAAGFSSKEIQKQAAELQKITGIGDETIISMQGIIASFKEIKGDAFERATRAVLDMSVVMQKAGQDQSRIEEGAVQVGKALNDPIRGMSALTRVGVMFTESQRQLITYFQETNQLGLAQGIILSELEGEFGGAAEGLDKTVKAGNLLKATFSDLLERIGEVMFETDEFEGVLASVTKAINDLADSGALEVWAEDVKNAVGGLLPVFNGAATAMATVARMTKYLGGLIGALSVKGFASRPEDVTRIAAEVSGAGPVGNGERESRRKAAREAREARMKASDDEEAARVKAAAAAKAERAEAAAQDAKLLAARMATHEKRKKITKEIEDTENKIADLQKTAARDAAKAAQISALTAKIEALTVTRERAMFRNLEPTEREEFVGFRDRVNERRKAQAEQVQLQQKIAQIRGKMDDRRRLSKGEKQFVSDFSAFKTAQSAAAKAQAGIQSLEQRRDKIQSDQLAELQGIRKDLAKNLEAA